MDTDDLEPQNKQKKTLEMEVMSIEQLEAYIDELESEIVRARENIGRKKRARNNAETIFKT